MTARESSIWGNFIYFEHISRPMGAFKAYFVLLIILLACTACGERNVRTIKLISDDVEEQEIIEHNETEEPVINSTREPDNPYLDHNYSDPLNHSQLPTSKPNELKRYKLYGTLIDLDNLTVDSCENTLKMIK